ncbi:MAG: type II toxin-antitoxin system prevent-host-death family antitoxin [Polyangiaceae bacterium]
MARTIGAAKFKEQCLAILDSLGAEGIIITKHNRPVARLVPVSQASSELIGSLRSKLRVKGDITSTGVAWDADAEP